MRTLRQIVTVCSVTLAFAVPTDSHANGPQVGFQAGMIFPVRSDVIQLVSEHVVIHLGDPSRDGWVECTYRLRNLSSARQDFQMAFVPSGYLGDSLANRDRPFEVIAGGQRIPARFEKLDTKRWAGYVDAWDNSLPMWDLSIPARESLDVGMRYEAVWAGVPEDTWDFAYNAKPAALWADSIDTATIEFQFEEFTAALVRCAMNGKGCIRVAASPPGGTWVGDTLVWQFRRWKPKEHVGIQVTMLGR